MFSSAAPGHPMCGLIADLHAIKRTAANETELVSDVAQRLGRGGDERRVALARYRRVRANEYAQDLLYVAPDRSFSIVVLTWAPGAQTCIHDHAGWCAVAVYEGVEHEQRYRLSVDSGGPYLTATTTRALELGATIGMLADGGDIHRVGNYSRDVTLSLHVYGLDVKQSGTSIKTRFDALPVRT